MICRRPRADATALVVAIRAFTMVELLIVIGIIALLISILLPALNRARAAARTTACLANLRQIGQAASMYHIDNKGFLVPAGYAGASEVRAWNTSLTQLETWAQILVIGKYLPYTTPVAGITANEPPATRTVFFCPGGLAEITSDPNPLSVIDGRGARGQTDTTGSRTDSQQSASPSGPLAFWGPVRIHNWYHINATDGFWVRSAGFAPRLAPSRRIPGWIAPSNSAPSWSLNKISKIRRASEMVFITDGAYFNAHINANRINGRHGNVKDANQAQTNVLFFDGRAATYYRRELPKGNELDVLDGPALSALYPSPLWRTDQR